MAKRVWTDQMRRDFLRMVNEGLTAREIAERMGRSKAAIDQMAFRLEVHFKGMETAMARRIGGNPFFEARKRAGLSRSQAADKIGISTHMLYQYENGFQRPGQMVLWRSIAQAYDCTIGDLLGEEVLDTAM